jgi:hypothetical protein
MPPFSRRMNKRYKKVMTRRKKNRFTRKYGVKNGVKNGRVKNGRVKNGGSVPALVIKKNEPLVWTFKTN